MINLSVANKYISLTAINAGYDGKNVTFNISSGTGANVSSNQYIPKNLITGKGDMIVGSGPNTPTTLTSSNNNGGFLKVNTSESLGLSFTNQLISQTIPTSSVYPGNAGMIASDDDYVYICVGTNSWMRLFGTKNF